MDVPEAAKSFLPIFLYWVLKVNEIDDDVMVLLCRRPTMPVCRC
jgi:hypothetical protein